MDTEIIKIKSSAEPFAPEEDAALRRAGNVIRDGGLVAFPTETVYGLGGDALNRESARKIYAAKGRPSDNPLIVHICRVEDLGEIAREIPEETWKLAEAFWPGPLTMIFWKSDLVPPETTGGLDTVAVRLPADRTARKLIEYAGGYVAAPSANRSGRPSPTYARYVEQDMAGRIEMMIDGGQTDIGLESTILDLTVSPPRILRPGYVTETMLLGILQEVDTDVTILQTDSGEPPKAPGMKYRHYAPKGELLIVEGDAEAVAEYINRQAAMQRAGGERIGVLCASETASQYHADKIRCVGSREDEESIARNLFAALRDFDDEGITRIYAESFSTAGLGQAVMNRLLKAAGHRVVRATAEGERL